MRQRLTFLLILALSAALASDVAAQRKPPRDPGGPNPNPPGAAPPVPRDPNPGGPRDPNANIPRDPNNPRDPNLPGGQFAPDSVHFQNMADYFSFKSAPGIEVPAPSSREEIIEQLLRLVNEQLSSQVTEALKDSVEVDDDALKPSAGAPSEENKRAGSAALARLRGLRKKPTPPDTLKASNETETDDGLGDLLDNQLVQIRNMLSNAVAVRGRNGSQADGSIPTETLSLNFERMPLRTQNGSASGKPFLMPVEDVFTISGRGTSSTNGHTPFFKGYRPQFYMRTSDVSRPAAAGDHWTFPARTAAPTSGALNPQKFQIISAGAGRRATITGLPVVGDWDGDPLSDTHGSGIPAHTPEWANPRLVSDSGTRAQSQYETIELQSWSWGETNEGSSANPLNASSFQMASSQQSVIALGDADVGIGNRFTRGMWSDGVLEHTDVQKVTDRSAAQMSNKLFVGGLSWETDAQHYPVDEQGRYKAVMPHDATESRQYRESDLSFFHRRTENSLMNPNGNNTKPLDWVNLTLKNQPKPTTAATGDANSRYQRVLRNADNPFNQSESHLVLKQLSSAINDGNNTRGAAITSAALMGFNAEPSEPGASAAMHFNSMRRKVENGFNTERELIDVLQTRRRDPEAGTAVFKGELSAIEPEFGQHTTNPGIAHSETLGEAQGVSSWRLVSAQPMKGKPFSTDYTMFLPNGTPVRSTVAGTGNEAAMESLTIAHEGFTPAVHRGGNMSLPEVGDAVLVGFAQGDRRDVEPTGVEFPNLSFHLPFNNSSNGKYFVARVTHQFDKVTVHGWNPEKKEQIVGEAGATHDERKQSLYFPESMLQEIRKPASDLGNVNVQFHWDRNSNSAARTSGLNHNSLYFNVHTPASGEGKPVRSYNLIDSFPSRFSIINAAQQPAANKFMEMDFASLTGPGSTASIRQEQLNNKYPENMTNQERNHVSYGRRVTAYGWDYVAKEKVEGQSGADPINSPGYLEYPNLTFSLPEAGGSDQKPLLASLGSTQPMSAKYTMFLTNGTPVRNTSGPLDLVAVPRTLPHAIEVPNLKITFSAADAQQQKPMQEQFQEMQQPGQDGTSSIKYTMFLKDGTPVRGQTGAVGDPDAFTSDPRDSGFSAIRTELLNNKYPENMKHEPRKHVSLGTTLGLASIGGASQGSETKRPPMTQFIWGSQFPAADSAQPIDAQGRYKVVMPFDVEPTSQTHKYVFQRNESDLSFIEQDNLGRVKVKFPWLHDTDNSNGSAGYGSHFPLHLGAEVLIDHTSQNHQMAPYALPGSRNISGLKSNSTAGGGAQNDRRFWKSRSGHMMSKKLFVGGLAWATSDTPLVPGSTVLSSAIGGMGPQNPGMYSGAAQPVSRNESDLGFLKRLAGRKGYATRSGSSSREFFDGMITQITFPAMDASTSPAAVNPFPELLQEKSDSKDESGSKGPRAIAPSNPFESGQGLLTQDNSQQKLAHELSHVVQQGPGKKKQTNRTGSASELMQTLQLRSAGRIDSTDSKTIIGGFKSVSGMDSETEVVELGPGGYPTLPRISRDAEGGNDAASEPFGTVDGVRVPDPVGHETESNSSQTYNLLSSVMKNETGTDKTPRRLPAPGGPVPIPYPNLAQPKAPSANGNGDPDRPIIAGAVPNPESAQYNFYHAWPSKWSVPAADSSGSNARPSRWVRMEQPYAGAGYGQHAGGSSGQPFVLGRLYNGESPVIRSGGRTTYSNISLKRGYTTDDSIWSWEKPQESPFNVLTNQFGSENAGGYSPGFRGGISLGAGDINN